MLQKMQMTAEKLLYMTLGLGFNDNKSKNLIVANKQFLINIDEDFVSFASSPNVFREK